jgi:hypothetical protein
MDDNDDDDDDLALGTRKIKNKDWNNTKKNLLIKSGCDCTSVDENAR